MQVSWDSPNSPRLQAQAAYDAQERSAVADLLRRYPNMSAQEVLQLTDPSGTIGGEAPPQFFGLGADMGMGAVAPGVYSSDPGAVRAVDGVPTAPMPPFGGDPGAAHYTESPAQIAAPPQEDPTRGMVHKIGASSKEIRTSVQNKVDRNEFAQYLWNMMNATPPEFNPLGFQKSLATPYERTAEKAERAYVPKK
jgi:hypothetical protein